MQVFVNGKPRALAGAATVSALLAELGIGAQRVAVEVNREIVPRSRHDEFQLKEQDRVEVVNAIGGG